MTERIADAFRAWRNDARGAVRTLPCVGRETCHDVDAGSSTAGLAAERGGDACAVLSGDEGGGWRGESSDEGDCSEEEECCELGRGDHFGWSFSLGLEVVDTSPTVVKSSTQA